MISKIVHAPADAGLRLTRRTLGRLLVLAVVLPLLLAACDTNADKTDESRAGRETLTGPLTLYVRGSDGDDAGSCLADAPDLACQTWQGAIDRVARMDLVGNVVTVKHGAEGPFTFTEGALITDLTGGGSLSLDGSATPGDTTFRTVGNVFTLRNSQVPVTFSQMTLNGGGTGLIEATYQSQASIGSGVVFGSGGFSHLYVHDSQALLLVLGSSYSIVGSATHHTFVNGGMAFIEEASGAAIDSPSFPGGFVAVVNGGRVQTVTSGWTGTVNAPRFSSSSNGVINTFGGGVNYFPGTTPGVTNTGGQYL